MIRKQNRLAGYDYSQPGAYFITVCVKDHRCLLGTVVGLDAHIGPHNETAPVGADAHIGPHNETAPVGADAHIGPSVVLSDTGKIVEKYTRSIPGIAEYTIMPNHVHMILRISAREVTQGPMWASAPTDTNIEKLMRSWKILITKELGQSIWQRSYYDHIIRDEQDYVTRAQYIMNNPAKWHEDKYFIP